MFSPEKILGGLLSGGTRRGGANLLTSQLGMGLLGVAIEAVDHYMKKSSSPAPPAPGTYPGSAPPAPPGAAPPPPPTFPGTAAAPPPPPGPVAAASGMPAPPAAPGQSDAVLLIRAMIAAANADGAIDQEERQRILDKFQGARLSPEENTFLINELLAPAGLEEVAAQVSSPELARQVYGVSLLAVTVDTESERLYLRTLGQRLGLNPDECADIHRALGIENL